MRLIRVLVVGVGALLSGSVALNCSSTPATTPYDAGALFNDGGFGDDQFVPDARLIFDAGDAAVVSDAPAPASDAGDDAVAADSSPTADSSVAEEDATFDGGEESDSASAPDVREASAAVDASDGSPPDDAGSQDASAASSGDAADSAAPDGSGTDAADAASEDASDAALVDAAGSPFDAAICSGFNLSGDAINGIAVTTSPVDGLAFDTGTTDPAGNPVPAADAVVVTITTSPVGVMEDLAVVYFTGASGPNASIAMSLAAAAPGATSQAWQASIPPMASGTQVQFWVVGHDFCKTSAEAGADYYSNSGGNYHYETE